MFTIADIRNIAIQIEKNGVETYLKASQTAKDPQVAKTLAWMAGEEGHHVKWFENITTNKPLTSEQQELENMGKNLLQQMVKDNNFLIDQSELENATDIKDVLAKSKYFEQETILFYEFLLGFLDDKESIQQLKLIIKEEQNHIKQLETLEKQECFGPHTPLSY